MTFPGCQQRRRGRAREVFNRRRIHEACYRYVYYIHTSFFLALYSQPSLSTTSLAESHDFKDDFLFYHLLIPGATRRNSVTDSDGQISVTHSVSSNSLDAESPAALAKPDTPDVVADRRASATVDVREYSDQSFEYRRVGIADPSKAKRIGTRPKEEAKAADIETIAVTGESPKPSGPDPNAVVKAGFLVKQGHRQVSS